MHGLGRVAAVKHTRVQLIRIYDDSWRRRREKMIAVAKVVIFHIFQTCEPRDSFAVAQAV